MRQMARLLFLSFLSVSAFATEDEPTPRRMSLTLELGSSAPTFRGVSAGGGARFEYAFFPTLSLIVPVEYRYLALGAFAENRKFEAVTGGIGARFYFSQLFWRQKMLSGFYVESHIGGGWGKEYPGEIEGVVQPTNRGSTLAISGALGYNHAFDFGLILGLGLNMSVRGYSAPIKQKSMMAHVMPELIAHAGWSF